MSDDPQVHGIIDRPTLGVIRRHRITIPTPLGPSLQATSSQCDENFRRLGI